MPAPTPSPDFVTPSFADLNPAASFCSPTTLPAPATLPRPFFAPAARFASGSAASSSFQRPSPCRPSIPIRARSRPRRAARSSRWPLQLSDRIPIRSSSKKSIQRLAALWPPKFWPRTALFQRAPSCLPLPFRPPDEPFATASFEIQDAAGEPIRDSSCRPLPAPRSLRHRQRFQPSEPRPAIDPGKTMLYLRQRNPSRSRSPGPRSEGYARPPLCGIGRAGAGARRPHSCAVRSRLFPQPQRTLLIAGSPHPVTKAPARKSRLAIAFDSRKSCKFDSRSAPPREFAPHSVPSLLRLSSSPAAKRPCLPFTLSRPILLFSREKSRPVFPGAWCRAAWLTAASSSPNPAASARPPHSMRFLPRFEVRHEQARTHRHQHRRPGRRRRRNRSQGSCRMKSVASLAQWLVVADSAALECRRPRLRHRSRHVALHVDRNRSLWPRITRVAFGQLRAEYGFAAIAYVRRAVELCMSGEADAMVTAPLNKEAVTLSGRAFLRPHRIHRRAHRRARAADAALL